MSEFWTQTLQPVLGEAIPWIAIFGGAAAWWRWSERKGNR